jgi:hypothetical protein
VNPSTYTRLFGCDNGKYCCAEDPNTSCCFIESKLFSINETANYINGPYPATALPAKSSSALSSLPTTTATATASTISSSITASSTSYPAQTTHSSLPLIIGIAAGSVVITLVLAALGFLCWRRRRNNSNNKHTRLPDHPTPTIAITPPAPPAPPTQPQYQDYPMKPVGGQQTSAEYFPKQAELAGQHGYPAPAQSQGYPAQYPGSPPPSYHDAHASPHTAPYGYGQAQELGGYASARPVDAEGRPIYEIGTGR